MLDAASIVLFGLCVCSAFAESTVISSSDSGVIENEEKTLAKVFGNKRQKKKNIIIEFSLLLDGELIGEVMVMVGATNKVFAESIKGALADYLLDEEIKKIDSLKSKNGFISLDDLKFLKLETKLNTMTLQLEINVPVNKKKIRSLGKRIQDFKEKPNVTPATLSGFVNTSISHTISRGTTNSHQNTSYIFTPAINFYGIVLEGECSYYKNSTDKKGKFHRDYTTFVYDYPQKAMTFRLGDIFSHSIDYHSVPKLIGLQLTRAALQESSSDNYSGNAQITLLRKSTIEVYVNDTLVKTHTNIAPGTYILDDIPYTYGSNDVKIKIIDDTGRERLLNSNIFTGSFLNKGDASWGITMGYLEINNKENKRYDTKKLISSASIQYGLMNATTLFLGIQYNKIGNAISSGIRNKNILGLIECKYAYSRYKENNLSMNGNVLFISYATPSISISYVKLSLGASAERAGTFFYPYLSDLKPFENNNHMEGVSQRQNIKGKNYSIRYHVFLNDLLGFNFAFNYNIKKTPNHRTKSFSTNVSKYISLNSDVFSYAYVDFAFERNRNFKNKQNHRLSINCCLALKNNITLSSRFENAEGKSQQFSIAHSPTNNGFAYNLSKNISKNYNAYSVRTSYSHPRFKTHLNYNKSSNSTNSTQVGLETGIFFADGTFAIAENKINDGGFVIVRPTKAIANEEIKFLNNRAESGILGGAVLSTSKNNINFSHLDFSDLPDNIEIKNDTIISYGYYKRGAIKEIASEGNYIVQGILLDERGVPLDLVSGIVVYMGSPNEEPIQFFTNPQGKFVIGALKVGKYRVTVNIESCEDFEIEIKDSKKQLINLGKIVCRDSIENN